MKEIVRRLTILHKTIACMESCTGGYIANKITNCEGASAVLKFSAITYSNEYKIKMGVSESTIDKYTVYSMEVAHDMAHTISEFSQSNYGIGITGKINRIDNNNPYGENNIIYVSIYDKDKDEYSELTIKAINQSREENKEYICNLVNKELIRIIKLEN